MSELRRPYIKYGSEAFDRFAARFSLPVRKSDAIIFKGITCIKSPLVPAGFAVVYPDGTDGFQIFDLRTDDEKAATDALFAGVKPVEPVKDEAVERVGERED